MGIYDDLADVTRGLLDPAQLGASAGSIVLVRTTTTPPANSWEAPTVTAETQELRAQAFGVSAELVGLPAQEPANGVVMASDRQVIAALPDGGVHPGDLLSIDGVPVTILRVWYIPAAGTASAVKFVVR